MRDYKNLKNISLEIREESFVKLTLIEKILLYELELSRKLFKAHGLVFDWERCLEELLILNKGVVEVINQNLQFFNSLYSDVELILKDKNLRTKFDLELGVLNTTAYVTIIIKSLLLLENISLIENTRDSMLHRWVVDKNIGKYSKVFFILNPKTTVRINVFKLIILLSSYVSTKKITLKKKKKIKTDFYLKFNLICEFSYADKILISYAYQPFRAFDNYLISQSYLTLTSNIKKSKWQLSTNNIDASPLLALSNREICIDFTNWIPVKERIVMGFLKKYNIKFKMFENDTKISHIVDELLLLKSVAFEENPMDALQIEDIEKDLQRLYYLIVIEKIKELIFPIYISHHYDFRGRIYGDSPLDPMYLKVIRAFYRSKQGLCLHSLRTSKYWRMVLAEDIKFPEPLSNDQMTEETRYFLILVLMELGKINKSKIYKKSGCRLQDFIDEGARLYLSGEEVGVEDYAYFLNLKEGVEKIRSGGIPDNITIIRDSTASFLQHWATLLGIKEKMIDKINLNGNTFYDIYSIIIDLFIEVYPKYIEDPSIRKCLERKILKKIIMTVNYNAGEKTSLFYLKQALKNEGALEEGVDYVTFMNDFHRFIGSDLFRQIFERDKNEFLREINNKIRIDDSEILLLYLKHKEHKEIIKIKNTRWIFVRNKLISEVNDVETERAKPANIVQACDASLARFLVSNLDCFSIHDSFGTSIYQVHKLMDLCNEFFNTKLGKSGYGLFILI